MAVCKHCETEMTGAPGGCVAVPIVIDDDTYQPIPYDGEGRCHDCNVPPGGLHHPGCDTERCPSCRGQLIGCGCLDEEDE